MTQDIEGSFNDGDDDSGSSLGWLARHDQTLPLPSCLSIVQPRCEIELQQLKEADLNSVSGENANSSINKFQPAIRIDGAQVFDWSVHNIPAPGTAPVSSDESGFTVSSSVDLSCSSMAVDTPLWEILKD